MTRPLGLAPGTPALAAAWCAALMIAVLTGASAVVILLVIGVIGFALAATGGWFVLRRCTVIGVATSDVAVSGDELRWQLSADVSVPVFVELCVAGDVVASGPVGKGTTTLVGLAPRRGVHDDVEVRCSSAGSAGVLWWRRCARVPLGPLRVGAAIGDVGAPIERSLDATAPGARPADRTGRDLPDGVRPWRDGDEASLVHWPTSLRSGELVVRQQLRDADEQWVVRARTGTADPDGEAGRVRKSLEAGVRLGAGVAVRVDDGDPRPLASRAEIVRWSAEFDAEAVTAQHPAWWRQQLRLVADVPERPLLSRARWVVAAAAAAPLVMLLQPLGYGGFQILLVVAATAIAAAVTSRTGTRVRGVRQLAGVATAGAVAASLIDLDRITSVASSLRFLMPQILIVLVVMQGFECVDRRSARVSLACSAILTAYAAGVRVDDRLALWLVISCVLFAWAFGEVSRAIDPPPVARSEARRRRLGRVARR